MSAVESQRRGQPAASVRGVVDSGRGNRHNGAMDGARRDADTESFLKSLGFPTLSVHHSFNHFDFRRPGRRILVIGPMGSGKTEYSARVWRDSLVARKKSELAPGLTETGGADRRKVFFVRSALDARRFSDYPPDALAFRGGYERCGDQIAVIKDSFAFEELLERNRECGTWIIDEASFYDERIAYVVRNVSRERGLVFIFPTLILNFRKEIFNPTARFLLDFSTDVFPLTAYCEHPACLSDSFYTYRYYTVDGEECPALYFDPLIVIGGDRESGDPTKPSYCTRCDEHHYLPGKEYTFLFLKPLGEGFASGLRDPLERELALLKENPGESALGGLLRREWQEHPAGRIHLNALRVSCIAEKALIYLFVEQNLIREEQFVELVEKLDLNRDYLQSSLYDNHRELVLS